MSAAGRPAVGVWDDIEEDVMKDPEIKTWLARRGRV